MSTPRLQRVLALSLVAPAFVTTAVALDSERSVYDPPWADAPPLRTIEHTYDPALGDVANGAALADVILALEAGDRLLVGDGTFSIDRFFTVSLVGTAAAPIRIEAMPGAEPVLTRPNANQNVLNVGTPSSGPTRYLLLRGFEITGGSIGIRIEDCEDLWIDECHIHHTGAVTVRASSHDTARLTITDNEIAFASQLNDTGEGLYLGANFAEYITHGTVVARNYVHDLFTDQGDGIELKQGSYGCWIAENVVHDTNFPGITVYGTAGEERNLVERNVVWNTNENAMQVQGEAIVRNNVAFGRSKPAFVSFDHQDTALDIEISHNTFVTTSGTALRVVSWDGRPGMRILNNALYSQSSNAFFSSGSGLTGVEVAGNVAFGGVVDQGAGGFTSAVGLSDFVDASFDGADRDVHPASGSALLGVAAAGASVTFDLAGATRAEAASVGAYEPGTYGCYGGDPLAGLFGEPLIRASALPEAGGGPVDVTLENAGPGQTAVLFYSLVAGQDTAQQFSRRVLTATDGAGRAKLTFGLPGDPALAGLAFQVIWAARDPMGPAFFVRSQTLVWE